MVNELSDRLGTSETTPERQLILDSHIQARIRDEIAHLKKDEEDVRRKIESVLEKENLDHEKSMAGEGGGANTSILLGDINEMLFRINRRYARLKDGNAGDAVFECYK